MFRLVLMGLSGCVPEPPCGAPPPSAITPGPGGGGNFLVVLLDDVGVEQLGRWGIGELVAPTPTLDCLCDRGTRFTHVWATPVCSPARASLYTGLLPDRTAVGDNFNVEDTRELDPRLVMLPQWLSGGYATGLVGKWHLGSYGTPSGVFGPNERGFEHFVGTLGNFNDDRDKDDEPADYDHWAQVRNGEVHWRRRYATTVEIDESLDFIAGATSPWMLVLATHAPHVPLHSPPRHLLSRPLPNDPSTATLYRAMLEAADHEVGRLLREMDPAVLADTTVMVLGDNGTHEHGVIPPYDRNRAKGTLFEGGIRVPMVVAGPHVAVPGSVTPTLAHIADLLPTIAELAGVPVSQDLDGVSFAAQLADPEAPGRDVVVTSRSRNGRTFEEVTARDARYKVIRRDSGDIELYVVDDRPDDGAPLPLDSLSQDEADALDRLAARLDR